MQTSLPPGGRIAQSVEQGTENPRVPSSILGPATIFCTHARWISTGLFLPQAAGTPIHGSKPEKSNITDVEN